MPFRRIASPRKAVLCLYAWALGVYRSQNMQLQRANPTLGQSDPDLTPYTVPSRSGTQLHADLEPGGKGGWQSCVVKMFRCTCSSIEMWGAIQALCRGTAVFGTVVVLAKNGRLELGENDHC